MTEWWFLEKSEPRTERITIAKHDMTVQLHALKADTTGFMLSVREFIPVGNCR